MHELHEKNCGDVLVWQRPNVCKAKAEYVYEKEKSFNVCSGAEKNRKKSPVCWERDETERKFESCLIH